MTTAGHAGGTIDELAGVVLAAGLGTRLRPLTDLRPKAMCPVADVPLVDHALARVRPFCGDGAARLAVNAHHLHEHVEEHLAGRVHLSVEQPEPLGTAGALGRLRDWVDGRDVLLTNADAWIEGSLEPLVAGWDHERVRLLVAHRPGAGDFGDLQYVGACLLPGRLVASLRAEPSGLYEVMWRDEAAAGRLDLVRHRGHAIDCGRPADYLRANLLAAGPDGVVGPGATVPGRAVDSVVGAGACVEGAVVRCVVWDGAHVGPHERLVEAVRADGGLTVPATLGPPRPSPAAPARRGQDDP